MVEYTSDGVKGLKQYLDKAPKRLDISEEDVARILGCSKEEYESLKKLESWPVKTWERGYILFGIDLKLGAMFGEGFPDSDYLKSERELREFLKTERPIFGNKSLVEVMRENSSGLMTVSDYVLELGGL